MSTLWKESTINSVAKYARIFETDGLLKSKQLLWYRGEGVLRKRRALLPSIARPSANPLNEWEIYQKFRQAGAAFLPHATLAEWDWLLYMRHYGVPTRLLDWSESPLVALYFAVEEAKDDAKDGAVWILDPLALNSSSGYERRLYCATLDADLEAYTPSNVKGSPESAAYGPVALIAARSFPRLVAQQGVFTITHRKPIALDSLSEPNLLARIVIPAASKASIRSALKRLGITKLSLFPELQSLAGGDEG